MSGSLCDFDFEISILSLSTLIGFLLDIITKCVNTFSKPVRTYMEKTMILCSHYLERSWMGILVILPCESECDLEYNVNHKVTPFKIHSPAKLFPDRSSLISEYNHHHHVCYVCTKVSSH